MQIYIIKFRAEENWPILGGYGKGFWMCTRSYPFLVCHRWYHFHPLLPALLIACFHHSSTGCLQGILVSFIDITRAQKASFFKPFVFSDQTSCWKHYICEVIHPTGILLWAFVWVLVSPGKRSMIPAIRHYSLAWLTIESFCQIKVTPERFDKHPALINSSQRREVRRVSRSPQTPRLPAKGFRNRWTNISEAGRELVNFSAKHQN